MSTLLLANAGRFPVAPESPESVRSTVTVVDSSAPPAVEPYAPGYNDARADESTEGGLAPNRLASHVLPSQKYMPATGDANSWGDAVQAVNDRISTSGTAAAREASGVWGHGTLQIVEGIEPAIRPGTEFGGDYFAVGGPAPVVGNYMTSTAPADGTVQATGNDNARDAVQASRGVYQSFLDDAIGRNA